MIEIHRFQGIWDIQNPKIVKELSANGGRTVSLIESANGRFILKGYPQRYTDERIRSYTSAQFFLSKTSRKVAPAVIPTTKDALYVDILGEKYYLMEFIDGRQAEETPEDEFIIGQAAAYLHSINDCTIDSFIHSDESVESMKSRYTSRPFKAEYDRIIDSLPEFNQLKQAFIHTDIGPHNTIITPDGKVIFVDLDDAGRGSIHIDIGFPLIMQCVRFRENGQLSFDFDNAKAFYDGYFSAYAMTDDEKGLIFHGAVFCQLGYMPCYGEDAVDDMWAILKYGIDHKAELMKAVRGRA